MSHVAKDTAKQDLRAAAYARRKAAHEAGQDAQAQAHLKTALAPYEGRSLAGYMPIRTEVSPLPVMASWAQQCPVCVPVIRGADQPLTFRSWTPDTEMIPGKFGAAVPASGALIVPQILIVPLVAYDLRGARLGYGGGYYDRTLERLRAASPTIAIGFAYGAQCADELPQEPTDQPLDMIVTERGVVTF
ncbi:MAG: 5-formyltetrahydrofolate cyclo-ligase [Maritimibacter sp.]